jgi:enamine deaminase RidA (YjgF/YER057c/UK114 family)
MFLGDTFVNLTPLNPPSANWPGLSQGLRIRDCDLLFLSGQAPLDADGELVTGDFKSQVVAAFAAVERVLAEAGAGFDSLVRLTYYVSEYQPDLIAVIKEVRTPLLSQACPPASVLIPVCQLYDPRIRIEIEAVAAIPRKNN